ncbi:AfsR/SARP family transcriptional regulator [Streptomyces sp. SBT349]|uniref:AfsR/SARP family transcriptional regulator n=1 Tax=Streptomyces sp. SBT349 TaxID=1580539 RepID=UPI00066D78E3|nr:BTAD domain-containing putative transcriptional regulator [Streptomyces sp. SBT349]
MEFRLFGEMQVRSGGRLLDVGTPRQQAVLAVLVVEARRPVAIETLVDRVWDQAPPANPRAVLYSHLSRIRGLLRQPASPGGGTAARIERRHAGYVLDVDPDLVDLLRFRRLIERGGDRQVGDEARAAVLAEALGLWRGAPLAGLSGEWAAQVRDRWHQRRLDAVVQWAEIELRLGHPAAVITTVPDLVTEYPLAEPLEALLMRALHAVGRGAEALDRYSAVRRRLADELGTDPGPELRALHQAVLRGDLTPTSAAAQREPALPAPAGESPEVPSGRGGADATGTSPGRKRPRRPRRRAMLVALVAVAVPAAIGSVHVSRGDEGDAAAPATSVERVQELFAAAQDLDHEGRTGDARATLVDAVRLYGELVTQDPDRNAPPLAPAIIQALGTAGVDSSVPEDALRGWLAQPVHTPYPAISQVILLRGWRLEAPVFLDAVVWNYENASGITSPRDVADVRLHVLEAAILENSRTRYGTRVTAFEELLTP